MATEVFTFDSLRKALEAGKCRAVNILHGEEEYFIDELTKCFEKLIPEEDRDFSLTNIYAPEVDKPQAIIDICRQVPMMSERQVVIVREAQNAKGEFLDKLTPYVEKPTASTVLVIASRGEKLKGNKLLKAAKKSGALVYETEKVWENQVPKMLSDYITSKGLHAEGKALSMLADFVGTNLSRLFNEVDKLSEILGPGATVTPESIERNIGVSKDYNNYELLDAVAAKDFGKMMRIAIYFGENPKENPYPMTTSALFGFFADLLEAYYSPDRSDRGIQQALGIRSNLILKRILLAMRHYNAYQIIEILDAIRRFDAMSKGSGSRQDPYELLGDLMFRIYTAPGKLPV